MVDCCDASGGRVTITANGQRWSARAAVRVMPLFYERKAESNQDGTVYTQTKPKPPEADITLSDYCGMVIEDLMGCPIDVTIDFIDMRRKYLFTRSTIIGTPDVNSESGEIRGLKVTTNQLKTVNY